MLVTIGAQGVKIRSPRKAGGAPREKGGDPREMRHFREDEKRPK